MTTEMAAVGEPSSVVATLIPRASASENWPEEVAVAYARRLSEAELCSALRELSKADCIANWTKLTHNALSCFPLPFRQFRLAGKFRRMESSSSRESSPAYSTTSTEEQHSEPDSSHLAALEKLLQASLGSQLAQYTANADPEPLETINSSPATYEELSAPPEPLVVEEQPLEDEVVGELLARSFLPRNAHE